MPASTVVGRRPIVDSSGAIAGYELRFRTHRPGTSPTFSAAIPGTADDAPITVSHGSPAGELERLTGKALAFIDVDTSVLTGRASLEWPTSSAALQVSADRLAMYDVILGCQSLRQSGYLLVATDVRGERDIEKLLEAVDIVKVDVGLVAQEELTALGQQCRAASVRLLTSGIDTADDLERARLARADLLEGLFVGRPPVMSSGALTPSQHNALKLVSTILRPEADLDAVEAILRSEPALAYQLLQLASIGRMGETRRDVDSIRAALVLMGMERLRGWVPALMLRPAGRAIDSRLLSVLARARTVELVADQRNPGTSGTAFAAGMLSAFDLLLALPRSMLAETLDVPPTLADDAFGHTSPIATLISDVIDYERGTPVAYHSGASPALLDAAAAIGFGWAVRAVATIDDAVVA